MNDKEIGEIARKLHKIDPSDKLLNEFFYSDNKDEWIKNAGGRLEGYRNYTDTYKNFEDFMADKYKSPYSSGNKSEWRSKDGKDLGTIDNNATIQEMRLLAVRYKETSNSTYKSAFKSSFNKAVNFLLDMQRSSGGFPQVWPKRGNYSDHITLNDNAMVRTMVTMMDIANSSSPFDSDIIDNATRTKMQAALDKAIDYLIRAQIINNGSPTVWCAQHDTIKFQPAVGRPHELPSVREAYHNRTRQHPRRGSWTMPDRNLSGLRCKV